MKHISVTTPCFNEEDNVEKLYAAVKAQFDQLPQYTYEHIFIDNDSKDDTRAVLRKMAERDRNVKVIFNARNFGVQRSSFHAVTRAATGDAVITMVADLQNPPALIATYLKHWEEGHKTVVGVVRTRKGSLLMTPIRKFYYELMGRLSEAELIPNFTGFGLYDRSVVDVLGGLEDPIPYFRGMVSELGISIKRVEYDQPPRRGGRSSHGFFQLYALAMLGFTSHSIVPLRLTVFVGLATAAMSALTGSVYLVYKLLNWHNFDAGIAPLIIGMSFTSSVQLIFLGITAEYVGAILTHVRKRPYVVVGEQLNFAYPLDRTVVPTQSACE